MINQIITNLVGNAINFTLEGKSVHIHTSYNPDSIIFKIDDQGIGIESGKLNKIFEARPL